MQKSTTEVEVFNIITTISGALQEFSLVEEGTIKKKKAFTGFAVCIKLCGAKIK